MSMSFILSPLSYSPHLFLRAQASSSFLFACLPLSSPDHLTLIAFVTNSPTLQLSPCPLLHLHHLCLRCQCNLLCTHLESIFHGALQFFFGSPVIVNLRKMSYLYVLFFGNLMPQLISSTAISIPSHLQHLFALPCMLFLNSLDEKPYRLSVDLKMPLAFSLILLIQLSVLDGTDTLTRA